MKGLFGIENDKKNYIARINEFGWLAFILGDPVRSR